MYSINDRLTFEYFEQALLLFKNFELNGARNGEQNEVLARILKNLRKEDLERLAEKHRLEPLVPEPWKKNLVGGSDDHASLNIASTYTEIEGVDAVDAFLAAIGEGRAGVSGRSSSPKHLAQTIYSVTYQFYRSKFSLHRFTDADAVLKFVDRALIPAREEGAEVQGNEDRAGTESDGLTFRLKSTPRTMQALLKKEARKIILNDAEMLGLVEAGEMGSNEMAEVWFRFVDRISEKVLRRSADTILENISGANPFDIFQTIGSVGSLYTLLVPYFVGYTHFTKDRLHASTWSDRLAGKRENTEARPLRIAHFTDTFHDVNGVATTLQMRLEIARKNDNQLEMITCGPEADADGITNFEPIGTFEMPEYDLLRVYYPPLLKMLHYCYEKRFTHSTRPPRVRSVLRRWPSPGSSIFLCMGRIIRTFLSTSRS